MAVIVLRHKESIFPIQITCLECGAVLSIEKPGDLSIIDHGDKGRECFVLCPDCRGQVILYPADTDQALLEYDALIEWR